MVGSTQVSGCLGDQVRKELCNCAYSFDVDICIGLPYTFTSSEIYLWLHHYLTATRIQNLYAAAAPLCYAVFT